MNLTRRCFTRSLALAPLSLVSRSRASAIPGDPDLEKRLEEIRNTYQLPALIGGIVTTAGMQKMAVIGVRKAGGKKKATLDDLWHLGSDTKAMTATLAALAVEKGALSWEASLASIFSENAALKNAGLGKVTIHQLLHHTSGLDANLDWVAIHGKGGKDMRKERLAALSTALKTPLKTEPGTTFLYSNTGYVLVGAVLEKITGKTWEDLIRTQLFTPLGMASAGFGGTGKVGVEDQPWPHFGDGKPVPVNGPGADNPPVMGPAGTVHLKLEDWARFIADHLKGARGEPALLKPPAYQMLHKPGASSYAMGWSIADRPWAGGTALTHAGSNTMNFCVAWLAPAKNFATLVCINRGQQEKAADAATGALIEFHERA